MDKHPLFKDLLQGGPMNDETNGIIVTRHGPYCIATQPTTKNGANYFLGWAKKGEIVANDPVREPGEVWFEFGRTREEVAAALLTELGSVYGKRAESMKAKFWKLLVKIDSRLAPGRLSKVLKGLMPKPSSDRAVNQG